MEEQQQPMQNEHIPNLVLLKILCIFTFVISGIGLFSFGLIGLIYDFFSNNLSLIPDEKNRELIEMMLSAGRSFFLFSAILYATSLAGTVFLWKMKKIGFHLFTASQLLLLILPLVYFKGFPNNGANMLLPILLIAGYLGYLKYMK